MLLPEFSSIGYCVQFQRLFVSPSVRSKEIFFFLDQFGPIEHDVVSSRKVSFSHWYVLKATSGW